MAAETGFRGDSPGDSGPSRSSPRWAMLGFASSGVSVPPPSFCCVARLSLLSAARLFLSRRSLAPGDRYPASPTGLAWRSDPVTHCIIGFPWTPRREARDSKGGRVPVMAPHALTTFYGCLSIFNERKPISYKLITKNIIRVISLQQINQQDANYRWSFGLELIY